MSISFGTLIAMLIAHLVGTQIDSQQIQSFIDVGSAIIAALIIYIRKIQAGDMTWYGKSLR